MKKAILVYILLSLLWFGCAYAGGQTTTISVGASVADTLDFTWNMHQLLGDEDPSEGLPDQTIMDFYNISEVDPVGHPGIMFTDIWYNIFLWVTADKPYHIKQTSQSLMTTDGQHNLDNSFVVTPAYDSNDEWGNGSAQGPIGSDVLGNLSLVKNANILYYGNEGKSHIVRLYYTIPAQSGVSGWQAIPASQTPGTYQGTITITITPQSP